MNWQEWTTQAADITLWKNHDERGLLKAKHIADYILQLWFEDNLDVSIYELDFYPLLVEQNPGGIFANLRTQARFAQVKGEYALIWPNPETGGYDEQAIDIAPECVRYFCEHYGKPLKIGNCSN